MGFSLSYSMQCPGIQEGRFIKNYRGREVVKSRSLIQVRHNGAQLCTSSLNILQRPTVEIKTKSQRGFVSLFNGADLTPG